jgi:hypothetical protein
MDELRKALDDEARRVRAEAEVLDQVKARAHRRRMTRQVGSGIAALAIAGAGFAVAFGAFRGPSGVPRAGPTSSLSPSPPPLMILVGGPEQAQSSVQELAHLLISDGYDVNTFFVSEQPTPITSIRFPAWNQEEAARIRDTYLPGASLEQQASPYHPPPDITITVGADYQALRNATVRVRVLDAGGGTAATDRAADLLAAAGYDIVEVGGDPVLRIKAGVIVACAPQHDEAGRRILEEFFPDALFQGEIPSPDHDVTVYIGPED